MRYFKQLYLLVIITALSCLPLKAEVTVKDLFFDEVVPGLNKSAQELLHQCEDKLKVQLINEVYSYSS